MSQTVVEKNLILDPAKIEQKIRRIAFEIYENNFKEKTIALAGVDGQGFILAELLAKEMEAISGITTIVLKIKLNKLNPKKQEVTIEGSLKDMKSKCVILVDDVLNTGRTLAYAMDPFFDIDLKKIEVAVLVNRSHPLYPIMPTYTGLELTTTLTDHVEVILGKKAAVFLK